MSVWSELVGQDKAVEVLRRAVEEPAAASAMTHAWLITGPPGSGRSVAARAFAAALQCPAGGCGRCQQCRTSLGGAHPDVTLVTTEQVNLRVEEVVPLVELAGQRPALGRWRVIVIEDADRLNDSSGNLLLKSIEEPPPRTVWLLCAPSPEDVLVTIRSRCRKVGLRVPPAREIAELLVRRDGVAPELAAHSARIADGHIGIARRLATNAEARNRRREVLQLPEQINSVGSAVLAANRLVEIAKAEATAATEQRNEVELAELHQALGVTEGTRIPPAVRAQVRQLEENQKRRATRAQRDVLDRCLIDLRGLFRDVLMVQLEAGLELINPDLLEQVDYQARRGSPAHTVARLEAIAQAQRRIGANVTPLLALEAMLMELLPA
jgi:DNA polymerase-3 subunit delta'